MQFHTRCQVIQVANIESTAITNQSRRYFVENVIRVLQVAHVEPDLSLAQQAATSQVIESEHVANFFGNTQSNKRCLKVTMKLRKKTDKTEWEKNAK